MLVPGYGEVLMIHGLHLFMGKFSWLLLAPVYGEVLMVDACTCLWGSSHD